MSKEAKEQGTEAGFVLTTREALTAWGRQHALNLGPFRGSCCQPELDAVMGPHYDLARFGVTLEESVLARADVLVVLGTVTQKQAVYLKQAYEAMSSPKWVIAAGVCTMSGGPFLGYHVVSDISSILPVDVYIAGCPPRPEAWIDAIQCLQRDIATPSSCVEDAT